MRLREKPDAIDLTKPFHRVMVLRACHALMSYGGDAPDYHPECLLDEEAARRKAAGYALRHWDELQRR